MDEMLQLKIQSSFNQDSKYNDSDEEKKKDEENGIIPTSFQKSPPFSVTDN